MNEKIYESPALNRILEKEIILMNIPSIVATRVLNPQPNEIVLGKKK